MAKSQMGNAIPEGYVRIEGSERRPRKDAKPVKATDPEEKLLVNLHLRRKAGAPPLPDMEHWANTPIKDRKYLSREEFGSIYGASKEDINKVAKFAADHNLQIKEKNESTR